MRIQNIYDFGDSDVLCLETAPVPTPSATQVLVKVAGTSVNPIDTKIRGGLLGGDLPMCLHSDFSGEVVAMGDSVVGYQVGDMVFGCSGTWGGGTGASAEYLVADYRLMAHAPKTMDVAKCAVLPLVSLTAMCMLHRLDIKSDDTVCVQSATGGVGYMALQIALAMGASVVGITSDTAKEKMITDAGAAVINRSIEDQFSSADSYGGFKKICNTVGTDSLDDAFRMVSPFGHIVGIAGRSDHNLGLLHTKNLTLSFVFLRTYLAQCALRADVHTMLTRLAKYVDDGQVIPNIHTQRFCLETLGEAHACLESGTHNGAKILVTV